MLHAYWNPEFDPPLGIAVRLAVAPWHAAVGPLIVTPGSPFTVRFAEPAAAELQPLVSFTETLIVTGPADDVFAEASCVVAPVFHRYW